MNDKIYIFHRADHFYPLELGSDEEAVANAKCNPGTTLVEGWDGRTVWEPDEPNERG